MEENVILILRESRIEVNKEKLASKSHYFASLFSHNFNDSGNKEHIINYDIALSTLQNFIEWIQDEKERVDLNSHSIKTSMTMFIKDNFSELLNLLQLSVLFAVDELIDDIVEIIVLCWLMPDKVIDTWLLAQELNVKVLQDICLSVCLDRFHELPLPLLIKLTKDNITQLIKNVNVRSSVGYLKFVRNEWMQHHTTSDIMDIKKDKQLKFMHGVLACHNNAEKDVYLYTWNGSVLSKHVQLKMMLGYKRLFGMQIVGRGFSVYVVGGESMLGSGRFNKDIWRYCFISKKWYYQASLPVPRRHMVVAFLKNKLVIVGGVGVHRLKLSSVDILDIHTGEWKKGAKVPECFTDVIPHSVMDGKLFLIKSAVYIYHSDDNYWETILFYDNPVVPRVHAILTPNATLFLHGDRLGEKVLCRADLVKDSVCEREECLKQCVEHETITDVYILHERDSCQLRYAVTGNTVIMLLTVRRDDEYRYLHVCADMRRDFRDISILDVGCSNIMDPDTLYNIV